MSSPTAKKSYVSPTLQVYGNLAQITAGQSNNQKLTDSTKCSAGGSS
jgi:hypothetical protein